MSFTAKGDFLRLLQTLSMLSSCRTKGVLGISPEPGSTMSVKGMGLFISWVIGSFVRKGPGEISRESPGRIGVSGASVLVVRSPEFVWFTFGFLPFSKATTRANLQLRKPSGICQEILIIR